MISNIQLISYGHSEDNKSVYVYFTWKMHVSNNGILQLVRGEGRFDIKESVASVAKEYLWVEARFHEFSDTPSTLPFSQQEFSKNHGEFSFTSGRIMDVLLRVLECIAFHYTPANNEIEIKDDKGIINQLHELISSNDWGGDKMEELQDWLGTLLELESEIEALEQSKKELKAQIQLIVEDIPDQKAQFPGIGTVQMTKAGTTVSYDKDALESLTARLLQDGEVRTAQAIADCRKETPKKSSLMFRRQKG